MGYDESRQDRKFPKRKEISENQEKRITLERTVSRTNYTQAEEW
jgi:hypothetical protein